MYKELAGIKIKGGYFDEECKIRLFEKKDNRISIVYGKNGSGKSSIASAIQDYKENSTLQFENITFLNYEEDDVAIMEDEKQTVYVYNEEYIEKNIKIEEDGLKSIVMFGRQVDLDRKIKEQERKLGRCDNLINENKGKLDNYDDRTNILSPEYHLEQIFNILKKDNSWAEMDSKIKGNKTKSVVNKRTVEDIYNNKSEESQSGINSKFNDLKHLYKQVIANQNQIHTEIKQLEFGSSADKDIIDVLNKKIEEPILSDREKIILDEIKKGSQSKYESAQKIFSNARSKVCPFCFQEVTDEYKHSLVESIHKVLNKEVDEHKKELNNIILQKITYTYDSLQVLDIALAEELTDRIHKYNKKIDSYREMISNKIGNIYNPITISSVDIVSDFKGINELLEQLENKRNKFNESIEKKNHIKKKLLLLNKQLAWYIIKDAYSSYERQQNKKQTIINENKNLEQKKETIEELLEDTRAEQRNIRIALNNINHYLEYIFYARDRLKLELKNDRYCVKAHGKDVALKNLSIGERNAISLCYFFSQTLEKCNEGEEFGNKCLVILDDPISSFDFENKIGIYSFIRMMLDTILKNNNSSRVIVFTHALEVMHSIKKISEDIGCKGDKLNPLILENKNTKRFVNRRNDYGEFLKQVYEFANMEPGYEQYENTIGNTMRRTLEAFSTFLYGKGIVEVSNDRMVLGKIEPIGKREYFANLMYRLVLNGESHMEERAKSIIQSDFYSYISMDEKIRTARDILVLMYLLNPEHITTYLKEELNSISRIKEWSSSLHCLGDSIKISAIDEVAVTN